MHITWYLYSKMAFMHTVGTGNTINVNCSAKIKWESNSVTAWNFITFISMFALPFECTLCRDKNCLRKCSTCNLYEMCILKYAKCHSCPVSSLSRLICKQGRLWSSCADAQADQSLRWSNMHQDRFPRQAVIFYNSVQFVSFVISVNSYIIDAHRYSKAHWYALSLRVRTKLW